MRLFLSYRRDDDPGHARLAHTLLDKFDVFFDVDDIPLAAEYTARLEAEVRRSDLMLVVIGPRWLERAEALAAQGHMDWVRQEVAWAFAAGVRVVPVFVGGAVPPKAPHDDEVWGRLFGTHGRVLHQDTFARDVGDLEAEIADLLGAPTRPPAPDALAVDPRAQLDRWSEQARAAIDDVWRDDLAPERPEFHLRDLYVPRALFRRLKPGPGVTRVDADDAEAELAGLVPSTRAQRAAIVGEAGLGKTSLLWRLAQLREAHGAGPAWLLTAERLRELLSAEAPLPAHAPGEPRPLLLLDTLDALLGGEGEDGTVARRVVALLEACTRADLDVVFTCRPVEVHRLREAPTTRYRIDLYADDELPEALRLHIEVATPQLGADTVKREVLRLLAAVHRGRPVRDVLRSPLRLRMLFTLYAPDRVPDDVDVYQLYDSYWRLHVQGDARAGSRDVATHAEDLSVAAGRLAVRLLAQGELEIGRELAASWLEADGLDRDVVSHLINRHVLTLSGRDRCQFFHQTFFEHAAARGLLAAFGAQALDRVQARLLARPQDLFVRPVYEQLVLLAAHHAGDLRETAHRHLAAMLASDDLWHAGSAVELLPVLPTGATPTADALRSFVARADGELLKRFLRRMRTLHAERARAWLDRDRVLDVVWHRADQSARANELLQLLAELAAFAPDSVVAFVERHDVGGAIADQRLDESSEPHWCAVITQLLQTSPTYAWTTLQRYTTRRYAQRGKRKGASLAATLRGAVDLTAPPAGTLDWLLAALRSGHAGASTEARVELAEAAASLARRQGVDLIDRVRQEGMNLGHTEALAVATFALDAPAVADALALRAGMTNRGARDRLTQGLATVLGRADAPGWVELVHHVAEAVVAPEGADWVRAVRDHAPTSAALRGLWDRIPDAFWQTLAARELLPLAASTGSAAARAWLVETPSTLAFTVGSYDPLAALVARVPAGDERLHDLIAKVAISRGDIANLSRWTRTADETVSRTVPPEHEEAARALLARSLSAESGETRRHAATLARTLCRSRLPGRPSWKPLATAAAVESDLQCLKHLLHAIAALVANGDAPYLACEQVLLPVADRRLPLGWKGERRLTADVTHEACLAVLQAARGAPASWRAPLDVALRDPQVFDTSRADSVVLSEAGWLMAAVLEQCGGEEALAFLDVLLHHDAVRAAPDTARRKMHHRLVGVASRLYRRLARPGRRKMLEWVCELPLALGRLILDAALTEGGPEDRDLLDALLGKGGLEPALVERIRRQRQTFERGVGGQHWEGLLEQAERGWREPATSRTERG